MIKRMVSTHRRGLHRPLRGALAVGSVLVAVSLVAACGGSSSSGASNAPSQITIGQITSGSGAYALQSGQLLAGMQFWADQVNKDGGAFVGAYNKKIPVKIITYNAQSDPSTAAPLYSKLLTQDKVNILSSDYGSVLTAPAVAIAKAHKQVLFTATGTGAAFYTGDPYIVLTGASLESVEAEDLGNFLGKEVPVHNIAIVYGENEFNESQATAIKSDVTKLGKKVVYYQGTPTSTTSYSSIIAGIAAAKPDAVVEFGYQANDIAFLGQLKSSGQHFKFVYTYGTGQFAATINQQVSSDALAYTFSTALPPQLAFTNTVGMTTAQISKAWKQKFGKAVANINLDGYSEGVVIGVALKNAKQFTQLGLRNALTAQSGKFQTVFGPFKINKAGGQIGLSLPVSQFLPSNGVPMQKVVYPSQYASGKYTFPMP